VRLGQEVQEVPRGLEMSERAQVESPRQRITKLRDQLKLLADYL
jgi:hypothetical protein